MADPNATGAKPGTDGAAAENADYVTKAEFEALNATLANIAATLKGLPNTVNKAAQDQLGRQLKALGLTPETLAKLTAPKPPEAEGEGEEEQEPPKPPKTPKAPKAEAGADKTVDIEALLAKQAAAQKADFDKRFKAFEESTTKKLTEERTKREAAERAQVELRGVTAAKAALSKHVIPEAADFAFAAIKANLHIAEDGTPYYRATPDDEDGQKPFADGVTEFLKSPGAKVFLPAPQGTKGGRPPPKTPPLPQNGASASIHDKLAAIAAADGVDVEQALS